jgi:hypothetical protein
MEHPLKDFRRDKLDKPKGASHSFRDSLLPNQRGAERKSFWKAGKPFFKKVFAALFSKAKYEKIGTRGVMYVGRGGGSDFFYGGQCVNRSAIN